MWEIKYRVDAIDDVLKGKLCMRQRLAEEFCYLQLRVICEVLAVACLVIHGNLKPKADLFKTYKASWIISELSKLHPNSSPVLSRPTKPKLTAWSSSSKRKVGS